MKKMQKGFTLIELMIVVAIIAILAAIALPVYRDYTSKAKIANALASVAGDKIKIAENYGAGKDDTGWCDGAATTSACSASGQTVTMTGSNTGSGTADTTVTVEGTMPADSTTNILWTCEVASSPTARYVGQDCDDLG